MPKVAIVSPGEGEQVLSGPITTVIVEDGTRTDHRLGAAVITMAPHTDGPPPHRHAKHDEGFYVVSGTPRFTIEGSSHDATPGTFVMVAPEVPHTFANPGDEAAVILNTFTPDLYIGYLRELRALAGSGEPLTPGSVIALMARYSTYPALPPAAGR